MGELRVDACGKRQRSDPVQRGAFPDPCFAVADNATAGRRNGARSPLAAHSRSETAPPRNTLARSMSTNDPVFATADDGAGKRTRIISRHTTAAILVPRKWCTRSSMGPGDRRRPWHTRVQRWLHSHWQSAPTVARVMNVPTQGVSCSPKLRPRSSPNSSKTVPTPLSIGVHLRLRWQRTDHTSDRQHPQDRIALIS